jgi:hypothetical protein
VEINGKPDYQHCKCSEKCHDGHDS